MSSTAHDDDDDDALCEYFTACAAQHSSSSSDDDCSSSADNGGNAHGDGNAHDERTRRATAATTSMRTAHTQRLVDMLAQPLRRRLRHTSASPAPAPRTRRACTHDRRDQRHDVAAPTASSSSHARALPCRVLFDTLSAVRQLASESCVRVHSATASSSTRDDEMATTWSLTPHAQHVLAGGVVTASPLHCVPCNRDSGDANDTDSNRRRGRTLRAACERVLRVADLVAHAQQQLACFAAASLRVQAMLPRHTTAVVAPSEATTALAAAAHDALRRFAQLMHDVLADVDVWVLRTQETLCCRNDNDNDDNNDNNATTTTTLPRGGCHDALALCVALEQRVVLLRRCLVVAQTSRCFAALHARLCDDKAAAATTMVRAVAEACALCGAQLVDFLTVRACALQCSAAAAAAVTAAAATTYSATAIAATCGVTPIVTATASCCAHAVLSSSSLSDVYVSYMVLLVYCLWPYVSMLTAAMCGFVDTSATASSGSGGSAATSSDGRAAPCDDVLRTPHAWRRLLPRALRVSFSHLRTRTARPTDVLTLVLGCASYEAACRHDADNACRNRRREQAEQLRHVRTLVLHSLARFARRDGTPHDDDGDDGDGDDDDNMTACRSCATRLPMQLSTSTSDNAAGWCDWQLRCLHDDNNNNDNNDSSSDEMSKTRTHTHARAAAATRATTSTTTTMSLSSLLTLPSCEAGVALTRRRQRVLHTHAAQRGAQTCATHRGKHDDDDDGLWLDVRLPATRWLTAALLLPLARAAQHVQRCHLHRVLRGGGGDGVDSRHCGDNDDDDAACFAPAARRTRLTLQRAVSLIVDVALLRDHARLVHRFVRGLLDTPQWWHRANSTTTTATTATATTATSATTTSSSVAHTASPLLTAAFAAAMHDHPLAAWVRLVVLPSSSSASSSSSSSLPTSQSCAHGQCVDTHTSSSSSCRALLDTFAAMRLQFAFDDELALLLLPHALSVPSSSWTDESSSSDDDDDACGARSGDDGGSSGSSSRAYAAAAALYDEYFWQRRRCAPSRDDDDGGGGSAASVSPAQQMCVAWSAVFAHVCALHYAQLVLRARQKAQHEHAQRLPRTSRDVRSDHRDNDAHTTRTHTQTTTAATTTAAAAATRRVCAVTHALTFAVDTLLAFTQCEISAVVYRLERLCGAASSSLSSPWHTSTRTRRAMCIVDVCHAYDALLLQLLMTCLIAVRPITTTTTTTVAAATTRGTTRATRDGTAASRRQGNVTVTATASTLPLLVCVRDAYAYSRRGDHVDDADDDAGATARRRCREQRCVCALREAVYALLAIAVDPTRLYMPETTTTTTTSVRTAIEVLVATLAALHDGTTLRTRLQPLLTLLTYNRYYGSNTLRTRMSRAPTAYGHNGTAAATAAATAGDDDDDDDAAALYRAHVSRAERDAGADAAAESVLRVRHVTWTHARLHDSHALTLFLNATHVSVAHNRLTDLDGLELLTQLRVVVAAHNAIVSTRPLAQLPELFYLDVRHNAIAALDPGTDLPHDTLRCLYIGGNACCAAPTRHPRSSSDDDDDADAGGADGDHNGSKKQDDDDNDGDNNDDDAATLLDARVQLARRVRAVCGATLEYLDIDSERDDDDDDKVAHTTSIANSGTDNDNDDDEDVSKHDVDTPSSASSSSSSSLFATSTRAAVRDTSLADVAAALHTPHMRRRLQHAQHMDAICAHHRRCGGNNSDDDNDEHDDDIDDDDNDTTTTTTRQWRSDVERLLQQYEARATARCELLLRHARRDVRDDVREDERASAATATTMIAVAASCHAARPDDGALVDAQRRQRGLYADMACATRQRDAQARRALQLYWTNTSRVLQTCHDAAAERRRGRHVASTTPSPSYADALRLLADESQHTRVRDDDDDNNKRDTAKVS